MKMKLMLLALGMMFAGAADATGDALVRCELTQTNGKGTCDAAIFRVATPPAAHDIEIDDPDVAATCLGMRVVCADGFRLADRCARHYIRRENGSKSVIFVGEEESDQRDLEAKLHISKDGGDYEGRLLTMVGEGDVVKHYRGECEVADMQDTDNALF